MQIASFPISSIATTTIKRAIFLTCLRGATLGVMLSAAGCAYLGNHVGEWCNTRAYVRTDLSSYIDQRFTPKSPVRVGVIPFDVPANLSARSAQMPGLGNQLAWAVQRNLLATEVFPIIEIFNREDWPRKKEQFFTGNFGALQIARDAGYDIVLVGYLEPITRIDTWIVHTKVIEVDSGTTIWYGSSKVYTNRADMLEVSSFVGLTDRRPDQLWNDKLLETVAQCIAHDMTTDPEE
jgi:hypothetical protein